MDDQDSPPLPPSRRRRCLTSVDILSDTPLSADLRSPQATRDELVRGPSPIDVDDLLAEILLRLPALPCSLPRASHVCTRWRRLVTDPHFLRRFCAHHWKPLGVFLTSVPSGHRDISFSFISDPRDSIPPERFSVPACCEGGGGGGGNDYTWEFRGCRHGLVLLISRIPYGSGLRQVLVWNPVAGEHHLIGTPNWDRYPFNLNGAVICASGDKGLFKVALAWNGSRRAQVCVYSSETGVWGDVVSAAVHSEFWPAVSFSNVLVGNSLYWCMFGRQLHILEFDLGSQNIAVMEVPLPSDVYANCHGIYLSTLAKDGGISLIIMSDNFRAQVWERTADSDGVARWVLGRTIELDKLLSLRPGGVPEYRTILGLYGDDNIIFVSTYRGAFMVHLKLMQFEKIFDTSPFSHDVSGTIHPFKSL